MPPIRAEYWFRRFAALAIDNVLCVLLSALPGIGGLLAASYLLFRDGFAWKAMPYRSLGKTFMKLKVAPMTADVPLNLTTSIKRNCVLVLPALLSMAPVRWEAGLFLMGLIILAVEGLRVVLSRDGRRFGDLLGGTQVIMDAATPDVITK